MTTIDLDVGGSLTATTITASVQFNGSGAGLTSIPLSSLATLPANNVVITNGSGVLTSTATVSPLLGGTGQNFSGIGAGPFIPTISSGVFSATLTYAQTAVANALVQMGAAGAITVGTVNTSAIATTGSLTVTSSGGGNLNLGTVPLRLTPATIAGGTVTMVSGNVQSTNATPTTVITFATASDTNYTFTVSASWGRATGLTGSQTYMFKVKNVGGTLTVSSITDNAQIRDTGMGATTTSPTSSGTNVLIQVTGIAAVNINWTVYTIVSAQTFV